MLEHASLQDTDISDGRPETKWTNTWTNLSLLIFAFGRMRFSNHKQRGSYKLHSTMWLCYFL